MAAIIIVMRIQQRWDSRTDRCLARAVRAGWVRPSGDEDDAQSRGNVPDSSAHGHRGDQDGTVGARDASEALGIGNGHEDLVVEPGLAHEHRHVRL